MGCSCNPPSTQPPREHNCFWIWLILYLSLAPQKQKLPSLHFHWTGEFSGTSQKQHGISFFSLCFCCVYDFSTFPSGRVHLGINKHLSHKRSLGIAPQNSNQEPPPILVGKSQHRTGDPIMAEGRVLVLPLKWWLKISVQISLGNYTEICFILSITQDLQAHTSSQFVLCDN